MSFYCLSCHKHPQGLSRPQSIWGIWGIWKQHKLPELPKLPIKSYKWVFVPPENVGRRIIFLQKKAPVPRPWASCTVRERRKSPSLHRVSHVSCPGETPNSTRRQLEKRITWPTPRLGNNRSWTVERHKWMNKLRGNSWQQVVNQ